MKLHVWFEKDLKPLGSIEVFSGIPYKCIAHFGPLGSIKGDPNGGGFDVHWERIDNFAVISGDLHILVEKRPPHSIESYPWTFPFDDEHFWAPVCRYVRPYYGVYGEER